MRLQSIEQIPIPLFLHSDFSPHSHPSLQFGLGWLGEGYNRLIHCTVRLTLTARAVHLGDVHFLQDHCNPPIIHPTVHSRAVVWMGPGPIHQKQNKASQYKVDPYNYMVAFNVLKNKKLWIFPVNFRASTHYILLPQDKPQSSFYTRILMSLSLIIINIIDWLYY